MPLIALAASALLAASAQGGGCMRIGGDSARWTPVDDHTILVSAGLRAYRITTTPSALLNDSSAVVETDTPTQGVVCSPAELTLRVASPSGRAGLIVQSITALSPKEAESLRHGAPKLGGRAF